MNRSRFVPLLLAFVALLAFVVPSHAQSRSLFESLFGNQGGQQEPVAPTEPAAPAEPTPPSAPAPAPQPAPGPVAPEAPEPDPVPEVQAPGSDAPAPETGTVAGETPPLVGTPEDATRVAVLGDSLAVDLASALERFYADDPGVVVLDEGVGSSGFVRDDFFDWNAAIEEAIEEDSFDVAVMMIGINDRQALSGADPLSENWRQSYAGRIEAALEALNAAGKPVIWLELPPMERSGYSADIAQISSIQRMAVFAEGGEWVETYERFAAENGGYAGTGPDLNGNIVPMRKSDGIHFSSAGADKLAFYVDRAMRGVGGETRSVASSGGAAIRADDLLAGTEAGGLLRPPFQGLGEETLALAAGSVQQLSAGAARASTLLVAGATPPAPAFTLEEMMTAPPGRVDSFGTVPAENYSQAPAPDANSGAGALD